MNHPEALLVPASMLIDYWLTVAGARLGSAGYSAHFKKQHYELNPIWQKAIAQQKWFNGRHLALTAIVGGVCIMLGETLAPRDQTAAWFFGCVLGTFGLIIGRHLSNLATFSYVRRHPEQITGIVTMSHELLLWLSVFQLAPVALTLLLISIVAPSPQTSGAIVGVCALSAVHLLWLRHHRRVSKAVPLNSSNTDG
jgi:uncharacterized membrane protein YeaQ/YmgE (transglycosylase-associated protein family)